MNKRRRGLAAAAAAVLTLPLGGCASDPAFWDNLAYGLDALAYELGETPVCTWGPNGYGGTIQTCQPAWSVNQPVYITQPGYVHPVYDQRRPDRRRGHDRRDRRHGSGHGSSHGSDHGSGHGSGKDHGRR